MKNMIAWNDIMPNEFPGHLSYNCLNGQTGCQNGCCAGLSIYSSVEFQQPGVHDDQECFFVLEGAGELMNGDAVYPLEPGVFFLVAPGSPHTIRSRSGEQPIRVIWFHAAI